MKTLAATLGLAPGHKTITPAMERTSSGFHRGLLRGLFDTDGSVQGTQAKGVSVRLSQNDLGLLEAVQRMLLRFGIAATIYRDRRPAGRSVSLASASGPPDPTGASVHRRPRRRAAMSSSFSI